MAEDIIMETQLYANNAKSTLNEELSLIGTSVKITDGDGELFPRPGTNQYFMITVENPSTGEFEILKATSRSGDIFTVIRSQEDTISKRFPVGSRVELRVTKGTLETLRNLAQNALQHFVYEQDTPSTNWSIIHNLNKYPTIMIMDVSGEEVVGKKEYINSNVLNITFTSPVAGKCYLN